MEEALTGVRIVVGIDGSPSSELALRWAAQEAISRHAGLDVVHAWSVPYSLYPDGVLIDGEAFGQEAQGVLDDAIGSLAADGLVPPDVRPILVGGVPAPALLTAAEGAQLLVVGSRGHGGFVGLLLGSVSQRCVEHAPCPVAVVPPDSEEGTSGRIVVGVDGSDASYVALRWAIDEASWRDARLDVVNAYSYHETLASFGPSVAIDPDKMEQSSRALLEDMVEGALGRVDARPRAVEPIPCSLGAAGSLLEVAQGADLLVVGSRGRGTFRGLLLGSVSRQCVHHARCPVVIVRSAQPTRPASDTIDQDVET